MELLKSFGSVVKGIVAIPVAAVVDIKNHFDLDADITKESESSKNLKRLGKDGKQVVEHLLKD
jgi:hypothetical protein